MIRLPKTIDIVSTTVAICYSSYGEVFHGIPAFAVDADYPKLLDTAKQWSKNYNKYIDGHLIASKGFKIHRVPNNNIKKIIVIGYEHRSSATVYKVLINNFVYDLQERVFTEALFNYGMKDRVLGGEFIWTRENQHMRLVLVNSKLHKAAKPY